MALPSDFGLSPSETLAHTARTTRPPGFSLFWDRFVRQITGAPASLQPVDAPTARGGAGAQGVTHVFASAGGTRIGCRVTMPKGGAAPPAMVVSSHGYHVEPGEPLCDDDPWSGRGLGVLKLRVRGYPGSQFDTGDLTAAEGGYIAVGLGLGEEWIMGQAVADVINGVRAARSLVGRGVPIMLHGESFGGGLAVLAASLLTNIDPVARLALGLPTFGDWAWRLEHPTEMGAGAEMRRFFESNPDSARVIRDVLPLFDAVVHAHRVVCPTVCKLALRDEVVPAPTAAAVFNALGTDPGQKWRFIVERGHAHHMEGEAGAVPDLRRHAMFERLAGAFLDPREELDTLMPSWRERMCPA